MAEMSFFSCDRTGVARSIFENWSLERRWNLALYGLGILGLGAAADEVDQDGPLGSSEAGNAGFEAEEAAGEEEDPGNRDRGRAAGRPATIGSLGDQSRPPLNMNRRRRRRRRRRRLTDNVLQEEANENNVGEEQEKDEPPTRPTPPPADWWCSSISGSGSSIRSRIRQQRGKGHGKL